MDQIPLDIYNFLIFIIPGFVAVWTFRYFTSSNKKGDFEFLGLSFIWGLILLVITEYLSQIAYGAEHEQKINKLLGNPYAMALVQSVTAFIIGAAGAFLSKKIHKIKKFLLG